MNAKLASFLAILALAALGLVFLRESSEPSDAAERGRGVLAGGEDARANQVDPEQDIERLSALVTNEAEVLASGEAAPSLEERFPKPVRPAHGLRLEGRIQDEDGTVIAGAEITAFFQREGSGDHIALGTLESAFDGSFFLVLDRMAAMPRARWSDVNFLLRVRAEGYAPTDWGNSVGSSVDEVWDIGEIELYASRRLVFGKIVDAEGRGIPEAHVALVAWGSRGTDPEQCETETFASGEFHLGEFAWGPFDLFASHPRHGIARFHGELDPRIGSAHVGELVLRSAETLKGFVVAIDGTPLPNVEVTAEHVEEDRGEEQVVTTDAKGRFEFKSLTPGKRRVYSWATEEAPKEVDLNGPDLLLRSTRPSIHVPVRGLDGSLLINPSVRITPADDLFASKRSPGLYVAANWNAPSGEWKILSSPGKYRVSASEYLDGERYSATEVFELGREHRKVELRLKLEHRVEVQPVVVGPDGVAISSFKGSVWSLADGTNLSSFRSQRKLRLRPGEAEFRVTPSADSFLLPFHTTATVSPQGGELILSASNRGGTLRLEMHTEGPRRKGYRVRFLQAVDSSAQNALRVRDEIATAERALLPGAYRVQVSCLDYEPRELTLEIQAGRLTEQAVFLEPKKSRR